MSDESIIRTVIRSDQKPTKDQIEQIKEAKKHPITYDDAPKLSMEQYAEMAAIARKKRKENVKPVVALRISPETPEKAKATGKGYTGFLSRLLDNAINDPELVMRSL